MARPGEAGPDLTPRGRLRAFRDATRGVCGLFAGQAHPWIHLTASAAAIGLGLWLGLGAGEWCWIALAIAGVWVAEALNTALESLADALHPDLHPGVGRAKDAAAAAVLLASLGAAVVGGLVLGPPLWERLAR